MYTRNRKSYLNLIHHVMSLLSQEVKLKYQITHSESNLDGLIYQYSDSITRSMELKRVQSTIKKICLNHEDLVELLRERVNLKDCMHLHPHGNAGHYREILVKEALELNKNRIGEIINPTEMARNQNL